MRPLIAGNWKMNGLAPQLVEIEAIAASVKATPPFADILICPPYTLIARGMFRQKLKHAGPRFLTGSLRADISVR